MAKYSATSELKLTVISEKDFDRTVRGMKNTGLAYAERKAKEGHQIEVAVLGPQKVKTQDQAQLAVATLPMDWKIKQRKKMVRLANELVQIGYYLELDPNLSKLLAAVIEGKTINIQNEQQGGAGG